MKTSRARHHRAASLVLGLLALCAWVLILCFAQRAGTFMDVVSVRYDEGQGVSPDQLLRDEEYAVQDGREDLPGRTLWKEEANQTLTDETGTRFASAGVLSCFGSGDDLYPAAFRFGSWPIRGDSTGIALDMAAANALWGGPGAPGQLVRLNGKDYTLRGVFEGSKGLALIQDEVDSGTRYQNLLLRLPGGGGTDEASASLNTSGMGGGAVLDLPLISWLLSALAALPGVLLMAAILLRILKRGWQLRHSPLLLSQYLLPALGLGVVTFWAAGFPWDIPARLIPTRFSDLDFWGKLAGEIGDGVVGVLTQSMTARDLALWTPVLACLLTVPVACALLLAALRHVRAESLNALLAGGLLAMLAALGAAVALGVSLSGVALALPVLWLAVDLALTAHSRFLKPRNTVEQGALTPSQEREETADETYQTTLGDQGN